MLLMDKVGGLTVLKIKVVFDVQTYLRRHLHPSILPPPILQAAILQPDRWANEPAVEPPNGARRTSRKHPMLRSLQSFEGYRNTMNGSPL